MSHNKASVAGESFDIVVIGAGIAGITAALTAQQAGARVMLLEKLEVPGGTIPYTSGKIWTDDPLRDSIHGADLAIQGMITRDFDGAIDWMRGQGMRLEIGERGFLFVQPDAVTGMQEPMLRKFEDAGGTIRLGAAADKLIRERTGEIAGITLRNSDEVIAARAAIIATGGFQLDPELVTRYIAPWETMFARANPGTTGDGFRMAIEVGVGTTAGLGSFYGHVSPPPPARIDPAIYRRTQAIFVRHVVLLNLQGQRFVDESLPQVIAAEALAKERRGLGVLVFDSDVHREYVTQVNPLPEDSRDALVLWRKIGARIEQADTMPELFDRLYDYGLASGPATRTMADYDRAAMSGSDRDLAVHRREHMHRCATPPFYAVPVHADITFTEGGLRVDGSCQALDTDGTPVAGLYVVGEAAGLVSNASQAGGLATGLVTGLRAGRHACQTLGLTDN